MKFVFNYTRVTNRTESIVVGSLEVCMLHEMPRQMSWGACEQAFGRTGNWGEGRRIFLFPVGDRSAVDLFVLVFEASVHFLEKS